LTAAVNDFGDITAVTDQLDRTTSYTLDALGRVRGITYPRGPGETWNNTTINYSRSGVPWQRVETTGNRVSRTTYDGLFHPVLQHDEDSVTGTDIFTARDFDHAGREVFASYPAGTNSAEALTTGTWTQFDALGRVTSVSADSELEIDAASPGPDALVTRVRYLDGFRSERTNALGKITTTRFQAWGSPSYELPIGISEPGGVTTSIERDGYGKPVVMTRSGVWEQQNLSQSRHYLYDDHQRLCANGESETGWNVVQYDALNNVGWNATLPWAGAGQYSGVNACNDIRSAGNASATRAVLEYTPRNQVQRVDHPAGTDDLAYTYYDDGTLHTASTADRNWTYVYNARGLVTHETLATAAHDDFQLNWTYDDNAAPSGLSYPSGLNVAFAPDAFGRPTQAGAFATGVSYHANGAISAFNYGNGIAHSLTLNRRQLPLLLKDTLGTDFLRHEHHYDANGNLTALNGTEQRSLSYDDRDRLTGASTSAYGIEAFEYDPLDNLREATTAAGVRLLTYDSKNRLDSMTLSGQNYNYVFNDRGDVQSRETPFSGASQFIYDNAHRVTGITHDALNAHRNESYQYDAHGLRVRTQRDGGQRYQVYSRNGQLLHVDDSRDGKIDYIYLGNTLVAESTTANGATTATIAYQHSDGRGTPSVETNAPLSGAPVVELSRQWLSSYGERYDGNYSDGPGFTGHATDANTRLSYMQQRYYDPAVGRFLSADPVAADANTGGNFNRYWYADNNPYTYTDPDGRLPILIPVLIFIAKELAAEGIEQATGVPMPTVKNAGRFVARKVVRAARRETLQRSAREGARRQREVMEQLRKENPNASVQNERYLRNADGDIVRDSSGTARRVDHAVIENGRARTIETTSLTADKGLQMQKEQEIINRGGTYIRDKITRELIPVEGLSELRRVK
jgi:RHS repeat-associated protein